MTEFGNPILRMRAQKVPQKLFGTPFLRALVKEMFKAMHKAVGVGLAAPQVGYSLQLAVIEVRKTKLRPHVVPFPPTVVINPVIVEKSTKVLTDWEGCLSLLAVRGIVPRSKSITVVFFDEFGKKKKLKLTGFQARVFAHEIDHLKGKLYVDRMRSMETLMTLGEFNTRVLGKGLKSK